MADIFLNVGETLTGSPFANSRYFGNTGTENVGLTAAATGATISQTVETVTLPGNSGDYLFQQSGNQLLVFSGATKVATITLQNDADGTKLTFANGSANATVSAAGLILTGTGPSAAVSQTTPTAVVIPGLSGTVTSTFTLTENTDIATANVFNAPVVVSPALTDRVNTLQDEDVLTGSDTSATANNILNATLGNANDNGGTTITPVLNNIQTLNLAFTGSSTAPNSNNAVTDLDVQDGTGIKTINITRVTQSVNAARVENIKSVVSNFSITNTNANNTGGVEFSFGNDTLKGANTAQIDLSNVQVGTINIGQNLPGGVGAFGVSSQGYETLTINSLGSPNTVGTFNLPMDTGTTGKIAITGTQNLTLGNATNVFNAATNTNESVVYSGGILQANGRLASIDASAFTGNLTLNIAAGLLTTGKADTSGVDQNVSIIGGSGNDTFILQDTLQAGDSITGGAGTDKIIVGVGGSINAASSVVGSVEQVEARTATTGAATIDFDKLPDVTSVLVRNEGQTGGATPTPAAATATFNLNNLTAGQAAAITIQHSNTGSNGITQNIINAALKNATGAADTVAVTIAEGLNQDPRFNFILNTQPLASGANAGVENITLIDADSESNTVALGSIAQHTGTLTLGTAAGTGRAGTFLNLDTTTAGANGGLYQYSVIGGPAGGPAEAATNPFSVGRLADQSLTAGQVRFNGTTVNAAAELGDVIVRVGSNPASVVGAQAITLGAGNDTVIFDNLNDTRAGLTISDTVVGGAGTDTLALDGNGTAITIGASEWTNVSQFENVRVIGNGAATNNAAGATNAYNLTLTNNLLAANKDANGYLNVIADNDAFNNTGRTTAAAAATPVVNDAGLSTGGVTIDARDLAAGSKWSFKGNEGTGRAADRIILSDPNIDGNAILDGGAIDNITDNRGIATSTIPGNGVIANLGNDDVIEVRNSAVVAQGDLANVKNFGTLSFTNDTAVMQVSTLQLNDTIVDNLVDSFQASVSRAASTGANVEVLRINAVDNINVAAATTGLTIEAGTLTDKSDLSITLGRGTNNVTTGGGQDRVVLLGNYLAGVYNQTENGVSINAQNTAPVNTARAVTDTINLGGGTDTLVTYGAINLAGATLTGVENIIANSLLILTVTQYNAIVAAGGTITFTGNVGHQLIIIDNTAGADVIDLSKIVVAGGSLTYDVLTDSQAPAGANNITTTGVITNSSGGVVVAADLNPATATNNGTPISVTTVPAGTTYTLTAAAENVQESNAVGNTTIVVNGLTATGAFSNFETGDILQIIGSTNIVGVNGGAATGMSTLDLGTSATANSVTLTPAQFAGFTTITAAGNNDSVILSAAATISTTLLGAAGVNSLTVAEGSTVTVGTTAGELALNISETGGASTSSTFTLGAGAYTGTYSNLESNDVIKVVNGTNLSGASYGVATLDFQNAAAAVTLTAAQAGSTAVTNTTGTQSVTVTDTTNFTTVAGIENYTLANGGSVVVGTSGQTITGTAGNETVRITGTITGTLNLGVADNDTLILGAGGTTALDISGINGGGATTADTLSLQGMAGTSNTTMTAVQYAGFAGNVMGAGGAAETLTLSTTATSQSAGSNQNGIENLVLGSSGNDAFAVTTGGAGYTGKVVLSGGGTDTVTLNNAAFNGATSSVVTISGLTDDKIASKLGATAHNAGYQTITAAGTDLTVAANSVIEIESTVGSAISLTDVADGGGIETLIAAAVKNNSVNGGNYTVVLYSGSDAGVYHLNVTAASTDLLTTEFAIEHIATLSGVGANVLTSGNFA